MLLSHAAAIQRYAVALVQIPDADIPTFSFLFLPTAFCPLLRLRRPLLLLRTSTLISSMLLLVRLLLPAQVEMIIRNLGLYNAKDTIVGNNDLRGVSGGERRRVTLGE